MENSYEEIKKQFEELNERQKELKCLYRVNTILKEDSLSLEEILSRIVLEIPNGYRFPEICKAQVLLNGKDVRSPGFQVTGFRQAAKIKLQNSETGEIRIYYTGPVGTPDDVVFLAEEQKLIDTIAESISQFITIRQFRELMKDSLELTGKLNIPPGLGKWLSQNRLKENEIRELLSTRIFFKKGELILKQDANASYIVLLTEGLARAYVEDLNSRCLSFKIIKPYDFVGLSSLFGKSSYGFSVSAIVPSSGYLIPKEVLKKTADQNRDFGYRIFDWYSRNFSLLYHKINVLGNKQALGRMADTLLYLWEEVFDQKIIENSITRKLLSELSGMSNENGVRILSELKAEGIIQTGKFGIELTDPEKLRTYIMVG